MLDEIDCLRGYVYNVVFYNEFNHYAVVKVKLDQKKDENVIAVGYFDVPNKDELCSFYGNYSVHPRFGKQFKVIRIEHVTPDSKEAVIRYLSSSLFRGVGTKCAEKIIEALGIDCIDQIKDNPSCLDKVNIKQELKDKIANVISRSTNLDEAMKIFVGYGINMKYLIKMDAIYGKDLINVVRNNPYILIEDIDGMGFKLVDKIAHNMGIESTDINRIRALLIYATKNICYRYQDTYTNKASIYSEARKEVNNLDIEDFNMAYDYLIDRGELVEEDGKVYYFDLYNAEKKIAKYLRAYINRKDGIIPIEIIDEEIRKVESSEGIEYSNEQKEAIRTCINNGISIITGGPGTGKTTVVNAIIKVYQNLFIDNDISLCAPTGRAAKRMSELTNMQATTIHRLLKWDLDTNRFSRSFDDPIYGDFLIVDEFSMVDCQLFYHLLDATYPYSKILLIGDDKQLPPVSPGDVLRDLLELNIIPTTELVHIHRQDSNSGIIPLCYDVRKGCLNEENLAKDDVRLYECDSYEARNLVLDLVKEATDSGLDQNDIQILAPMYDGNAGITSINDLLRDYFNPITESKKEVAIGRTTYREGDKILQLKNQPDDDVYNGDIGYLEEIVADENGIKLIINFDDNRVTYTSSEFQNITHAYCISVHKSQGSEYNYVIMIVLKEHQVMLKRKLIYTGISRAKKKLCIIGNKQSLVLGIKRIEQSVRKTSLKERIKEVL